MDASGNGWISDAIRCYDYCARMDAHIVSNSWGVYANSQALQAAMEVMDSTSDCVSLLACYSEYFMRCCPQMAARCTVAANPPATECDMDGSCSAGAEHAWHPGNGLCWQQCSQHRLKPPCAVHADIAKPDCGWRHSARRPILERL